MDDGVEPSADGKPRRPHSATWRHYFHEGDLNQPATRRELNYVLDVLVVLNDRLDRQDDRIEAIVRDAVRSMRAEIDDAVRRVAMSTEQREYVAAALREKQERESDRAQLRRAVSTWSVIAMLTMLASIVGVMALEYMQAHGMWESSSPTRSPAGP